MKIKQIPVNDQLKEMFTREGSLWVKSFISNTGLAMLYSLDKTHHGTLHHLSISREKQYPDWDDIVQTKEVIMGDIDTMMIIPKRIDYINVMNYCFHIWETPEEWNIQ